MSKQIIKGDELQLFINNGAPKFATSHQLTLTGNSLDRNTKDDGFWGSSEVGKLTWELTAECLYTDGDYDTMFQMMIAHQPITLSFGKVKNYSPNGLTAVGGDVYYWVPDPIQRKGKAYVTSLTANANTGENATYSITFTGAGPLKVENNTITTYFVDVTYDSRSLIEGMQLFDMRAYNYINSGWVYSGRFAQATAVQLDISDGKLHGAWPDNDPVFRFYFVGNLLPDYMFRNIASLRTLVMSSNMREFGQYSLAGSGINSISTSNNSHKWGDHCCAECLSLEHINYQNSKNYLNAKSIQGNAFNTCVRLGTISTGDACTFVGIYAFADCASMTEIYFGDSLTNVNDYAFSSSQMQTMKDFHFYTEKAPVVGGVHESDEWTSHAFGLKSYQSFILHNSASAADFVQGTDMATYYPVAQCDYQVAM